MILATLTVAAICQRCNFSEDTHYKKAVPIAAQRAKVPVEEKSILILIARESGGNRFCYNKSSKCYGIGQFKPFTWKSVGIKKTDCSICQIEAMYLRCKFKYKTVANALEHSYKRNWY